MRICIAILTGLWASVSVANPERVVYVDGSLFFDCAGRYDAQRRSCMTGTEQAYATLESATAAASPGTHFIVREGSYEEALHLTVSGTASAPIRFTAAPGEKVHLKNTDSIDGDEDYGPIWLDGVSYNHVEGFTVSGSVGFLRAVDAHYNVVRGNTFDTAEVYPSASKRGGLYFAWSNYNRIADNRIIRGTDSLSLVHSNFNVVENNHFDTAGHDVWSIKCGSHNVIRGNFARNPKQKIGSVFDCEAQTTRWAGNGPHAVDREILDASRRNLIEGNAFAQTIDYYSTSGGNGIQYAGQQGIIRRNVFYQNNVGLGMTHYGPEADYNWGNRVYNNVFHDNICGGLLVIGADAVGRVEDNRYVNNVFWDNHGWGHEGNCLDDQPGQIVFRGAFFKGHHLTRNLIASPAGKHTVVEEFGNGWLISEVQAEGTVSDTLEADPRFVDAANRDYRAQDGSPMIDAGAALTTVTEANGSGQHLTVEDAGWFYDGFGIPGEAGDLIRIGESTARIIGIDYERQVISLDRQVTWRRGDPVYTAYEGNGPDLGVHER